MKQGTKGFIYIHNFSILFCTDECICASGGRTSFCTEEFLQELRHVSVCGCYYDAAAGLCQMRAGNFRYLLLRSVFGTLGILCNFYAVGHLVLADASMLNKMSPFFAIIFSYLILKRKIASGAGTIAVAKGHLSAVCLSSGLPCSIWI